MDYKLSKDNCVFLFLDQQEKLLPALDNSERLMKYSIVLAKLGNIFDIPGIITTQYAKGLGDIHQSLDKFGYRKFDKITFSAYLNEEFRNCIEDLDRSNIIISGAETHICVYQTARDLVADGYNVFILADGVASRTEFNYNNGLELLRDIGCVITNTETVLFDILQSADVAEFKEAQSLII